MKRKLYAGTTSVALPIFVYDSSSSTGAGLAIVYNTSGLVAEYRRQGQSSWTAIGLSAGTLGTYSNGGLVADGSLTGAYELGVPDLAFASGARWVVVRLRGVTNMRPVLCEFELDAVNYQDAVRLGLTALPNAAAGANNGLPLGNASGQVVAASVVDKANFSLSDDNQNDIRAKVWGVPTSTTFDAGSMGQLLKDNVNATISSRMATFTYTAPPTAVQIRTEMDANSTKLDVAVSSRLATAGYTAAPTAAAVRAEMDANSTKLGFLTGSVATASQIPANFTAATFSASGVFAAAALANAPTGSGGGLTQSDVQAAMTTQGFTTDRAGKLDQLDAAVSTRSTFAGGAVASVTAPVSLDLAQAVPRTNTAETVGDALNAARAQGFGSWALSEDGLSLYLYASDGTTAVRTFTLNDAVEPTART